MEEHGLGLYVETEIRGFIPDPEAVLDKTVEIERYRFEDVFYFPTSVDTSDLIQWHPRHKSLRLRLSAKDRILFSTQGFEGSVKRAKKRVLAEADRAELKELLEQLGFQPLFTIRRRGGKVLALKADRDKTFVLEDIENVGWMFEAHIGPGEVDTFLESLGLRDGCLLKESLPAYYYNNVVRI